MEQNGDHRDAHIRDKSNVDEFRRIIVSNFSPSWYLTHNPDVRQAGVDPLEHWFANGFNERRPVSPDLTVRYEPPSGPLASWQYFNWQSEDVWIRVTKTEDCSRPDLFVPPGHYYSPIVDPQTLKISKYNIFSTKSHLHGITVDFAKMTREYLRLQKYFKSFSFSPDPGGQSRYYHNNEFFCQGDALVLFAVINNTRPNTIIEVGSGISTAVILDALDCMPIGQTTNLTCIEPHPERLFEVIRPDDGKRVDIHVKMIQEIDLGQFASLEANDILFLDTSHISKTGSDVNHEIFNILPILKPGVLIHFHDIFYNFEYPEFWAVQQNRSWNEQYILRAFLMYNSAYEIYLFNDAILREMKTLEYHLDPRFKANPGGSLWLKKIL